MQTPVPQILHRQVKYLFRHSLCKRWLHAASLSPAVIHTDVKTWTRFHAVRRCSTENGSFLAQHLQERTLLRISGQDASDFLQGLITNDMECLNYSREQCGGTLYAFLLNVQGRVLYDMILYAVGKRKKPESSETSGPALLLECTAEIADDLLKLIKRFRIRKKIDIASVGNEYKIWAVFPSSTPTSDPAPLPIEDPAKVIMCEPDPRLKLLGHRLVLPADVKVSSVLPNVEEVKDERLYKEHRYRLGVAEGTSEMPIGGCLPLESNAVFLKGVNFNKGCYIGQELTARTYHTGLTRKRIMPLLFDGDIQSDKNLAVHNKADKKCGMVRGLSGQYGIGLLRIPDTIGKGPLSVKDEDGETLTTVKTHIPTWWQTDTDQILKQVMTDFPDEVTSTNQ